MSQNIPTWYIQQYTTNVQMLVQQMRSLFRDYVTEYPLVGASAAVVDQVAPISMSPVVGRFGPLGRVDATFDRRWVFPQDFELPQLIDNFDKLRLLVEPQSIYVQNAVAAYNRQVDDLIIPAFFGVAQTGVTGATATSFPSTTYPTAGAQTVSVNTGGTASNMNVAKLKQAYEILLANEVDLENDMICCAITAKMNTALMKEIEIINRDYSGIQSAPTVNNGFVTQYNGIHFIHTERLQTGTDDAAGTSTAVPMWVKSGMALGLWNDLETDVRQRGDLTGLPWQVYVKLTANATRKEEKKVVRIWAR